MKAPQVTEITIHPAGQTTACIRQIIDLGIQPPFKDGDKPKHQIVIVFETNNKRNEDYNHTIFKYYTLSLHAKATLPQDLAQMRGKLLTNAEKEVFDFKKLINTYCSMNVMHYTNAQGGERAKIAGFMPMAADTPRFKPTCPALFFDLEGYTEDEAKAVPQFLYEKINFQTFQNSSQSTPNFDDLDESVPGW